MKLMRPALPAAVLFPVLWVFWAFLITQGVLAVGISLSHLTGIWWVAFLFSSVSTVLLFRSETDDGIKTAAIAGGIGLLLWLVFSAVAFFIHDFSWDGQAYHQEAILRLSGGWNPWARELQAIDTEHRDWINPYPKATWQVGALLFQLWGRIETAKAVAWLIGFSASGLGFLWAGRVAPLSPAPRLVWATFLLFAINPVVLCQWPTFQVDGVVTWCLAGLFWSLIAILLPEQSPLNRQTAIASYAVFTLLLCSVKFTGLVYAVYATAVLGAVYGWRVVKKQKTIPSARKLLIRGTIIATVSLLCLVNPYYHNIVRHGHFLWPVMGPHPKNVVGFQEHPDFLRQNRVVKFFWANNARSRNIAGFLTPEDPARYGKPVWKVPFSVSKSEIRPYVAPDVHIGGFGVWYGGVLILATGLIIVCAIRDTPYARALLYVWGAIWGSVLINPEAWWARYSPQAWWLVLLPIGVAIWAGRSFRLAGTGLVVLLFANVLFVGAVNAGGQLLCERALRQQFALLHGAPTGSWQIQWGMARSNRQRFAENGFANALVMESPEANTAGWYRAKLVRTDTAIWTNEASLANALESATPGK